MAVWRALLRLLHVRAIEEEQHRLALDSVLAELHALENALAAAHARSRAGKALLARSLSSREIADRTAAHVEIEAALRSVAALGPRIAATQVAAQSARQAYLCKRLERRQAETLIDEARARDSLESRRRGQQDLDEAFITRRQRLSSEAGRRQASAGPEDPRPQAPDLEQEGEVRRFEFPQLGTESHL